MRSSMLPEQPQLPVATKYLAGWLLADIVYGAPTYQHLFDSKVATAVGWRKI